MSSTDEITNLDMIHPDLRSLARPLGELQLLPGNPKRGDVDAVVRSYEQFGQRKPIVVKRSDMTITAGNTQYRAATRLGWSHIAAVIVDDDDVTAGAFALADNRTADLGTYDDADLLALIQSIESEASAELMAATGYDNADVLQLLQSVNPVFVPETVQPRLDVHEHVTCPNCGGEFELRRGNAGAQLFKPGTAA